MSPLKYLGLICKLDCDVTESMSLFDLRETWLCIGLFWKRKEERSEKKKKSVDIRQESAPKSAHEFEQCFIKSVKCLQTDVSAVTGFCKMDETE